MEIFVWIVVMVIASLALVATVRRLPPAVGLAAFVLVAPIAVLARPPGADAASPFALVKLGSVVLGVAYLQALKLTRWADRPFVRAVAWALLAVNILEAVVAEAAQGGLVNAAAGVLVLLAIPGPGGLHVTAPEAGRDVRYPLPWFWITAYTLWNFTFVYGRHSHGSIGPSAVLAVIHLGAPLLATRGDGALYLQARAYALGAVVIVHMGLPYPPFDHASPGWYVPAVARALGLAGVAVAAFACGARLYSGARRSNPIASTMLAG